jgi:hypothetical protein
MKRVVLLTTLVFLPCSEAMADACDDLISAAQGALAQSSPSPEAKSQLEGLLEFGRSAKAKGDIASCEAATTGSLQSPAPSGRSHKCENSEQTV